MRQWCSGVVSMLAGLAIPMSGCDGPAPSESGGIDGVVLLSIRMVPDGVGCFEVTAVGSRTERRTFPLFTSSSFVKRMEGMPTGPSVAVQGAAYNNADCTGTPTWTSDTVTVALVSGVPTNVSLFLRPNGIVSVQPSFIPDDQEPVVDQSVRGPGGLAALINEGCRFVGQTYTAGVTGVLYGVAIDVKYAFSGYPLRVALRRAVGGLPEASSLTEITLTSDSSSMDTFVLFPQTIPQKAGETYAIVVDYPSAPPAGPNQATGVWTGENPPSGGDVYPGGGMVCSPQDGLTWTLGNETTLHFETRVFPDCC